MYYYYSRIVICTLLPFLKENCLSASIAMKRYHDCGNSYKGKHFPGQADHLRGLVHYYPNRRHGSVQVDIVLERKLRVLHLDLHAAGRDCDTLSPATETSRPAPSDALPATTPALITPHLPIGTLPVSQLGSFLSNHHIQLADPHRLIS